MADTNFRRFVPGIQLKPQASSNVSQMGDLDVDTPSTKLNYHNGTTSSPVVTEAHTATLTNKTLTGNTATNLVNGSGTLNLNSTGTVTVPNTTDTLVGKNTTDTLTNKTLSGNTATNLVNGAGTFNFNSTGTITVPNATDTLVGKTTTDTLSNKTLDNTTSLTIKDVNFVIQDDGDTTKQAKFQVSSIATGTTKTFTFPDVTDTLVTLTATQTLTNKSLVDTSTAIVDAGDNTKQIKFDAAGTTGTSTTILSSQTTNRTITLPDRAITVNLGTSIDSGAASNGQFLTADGAGGSSFTTSTASLTAGYDALNYSLTGTVATNALTVSLKTAAGATPSGGDPVKIAFRNSTATTGTVSDVSVTAALSVVVSSGSTLGTLNAVESDVHVWAINNAGTVELAVSGLKCFDENNTYSTTAEGGAGAADSANILYSTTARTGVAIRYLGSVRSTQATAGTWATAPSQIRSQGLFSPPVSSYGAYGTLVYPRSASNVWTVTNTAFTDYPANANAGTTTVTGACSDPGSKILQVNCNNMPPGFYQVIFSFTGSASAADAYCSIRLIDDSSNVLDITGWRIDTNAGTAYPGKLIGYISYTTTANRTFRIQGAADTGANRVRNDTNYAVNGDMIRFTIVRLG